MKQQQIKKIPLTPFTKGGIEKKSKIHMFSSPLTKGIIGDSAFTLVELIVSIMIVAILATIWFYSYVWYLTEARDAERKANMWEIKTALKLYKQKRWAYPIPGDKFNLTNNSNVVAYQWFLSEDVTLSTMDKIPKDPYTNKYYFYSITPNKQEAQVALTLENWDFPVAMLDGDYKTVSENVLPSILLATGSTAAIEIHTWVVDGSTNRHLFILDGWQNLPYSISKPYDPYYAGESVDDVLASDNINFWHNSDYRTCTEIEEAAKLIHDTGSEEYQILHENGYLMNTWCTLP